MKKIIFALAAISLMVACHNPQKQGEKIKSKMTDKINSVCQPTPDQENKVMPLIDNFVNIKEENQVKYGSDEDALKKANMANRNHLIDTLKTILTPDQFGKLKDAFQQIRAKRDGGQDGDQQ